MQMPLDCYTNIGINIARSMMIFRVKLDPILKLLLHTCIINSFNLKKNLYKKYFSVYIIILLIRNSSSSSSWPVSFSQTHRKEASRKYVFISRCRGGKIRELGCFSKVLQIVYLLFQNNMYILYLDD